MNQSNNHNVPFVASQKIHQNLTQSQLGSRKDQTQIPPHIMHQLTKSQMKSHELNLTKLLNYVDISSVNSNMLPTITYQVIMFLVNLTCLLIISGPYYIYEQVRYRIINDAVKLFKTKDNNEIKRAIKLCLVVLIDISLPFSVILVIFTMTILPFQNVYFVWIETCFVFYFCYVIMAAVFSVKYKPGYENIKLFEFIKKCFTYDRIKHFRVALGLGSFYKFIYNRESNQAVIIQSKTEPDEVQNARELKKKLTKIFKRLQIEEQFLQFAFIYDDLKQETFQQRAANQNDFFTHFLTLSNQEVLNIPYINFENYNIYTNRNAYQVLWVLYRKTLEELKKKSTKLNDVLILLVILFFKIIVPLFVIIRYYATTFNFFYSYVVFQFYIYILMILYRIINNTDIKKRTALLHALNQLVDFFSHIFNQKHHGANANIDTQVSNDQFGYYGLKDIELAPIQNQEELLLDQDQLAQEQFNLKLDVTCQLSLETWDNMRRSCILFETEKTEKNENAYIFLGIYWLFILIILLQVSFNINIIIADSGIFYEPIVVLILFIDFFLVIVVFFQRIYYGSAFNDYFTKNKDSLTNLEGIFNDLEELQCLYFNSPNEIQSESYKKIVDRLKQKAHAKFGNTSGRVNIHYNEQVDKYISEQIQLIKKSLLKIKEQVIYDEQHYSHLFLKTIISNFESQAVKIALLLLPITPPIIKALFGQLQIQNMANKSFK